MRGIKKLAMRFLDIRERRPDTRYVEPDDEKDTLGDVLDGTTEQSASEEGFPSEGEMTDGEASVALGMVMDAQQDDGERLGKRKTT